MHHPALPIEHQTGAHTEADSGHGPTLLGLSAEGWVYVSLTIFILLAIFVGKAPRKIAQALDARIAETRRQLDEAKAVRAEAEGLLADARRRQQAAASDAEAIMRQAETAAKAMVAKAEGDAEALIERRARMAEDTIAAAERTALAEVRATAAEAATKAAAALIAAKHGADADAALVDKAIAGLGRLN